MTHNLRQLVATTTLILLLSACDGGQPANDAPPSAPPQVELTSAEEQALSEATLKGWQLATPVAQEAAKNADSLLKAIETLLQEPSPAHLKAAQKQWLNLALRYQPLELYSRLAELQPDAFGHLHHLLYATGAYPIQPGYLDSFGPYQYSGLVHDISVPISPEMLREQHGMTDAADAALGLYAVEFLLFGPSGSARTAEELAQEPLTPELREQGFTSTAELPRNRRRQLLLTQVQLLASDLEQLARHWPPEAQESFFSGLANQPTLKRYLLLMRSAQVELSRVLSALSEHHPVQPQDEPAPEAVDLSGALPLGLLVERVKYLQDFLQTLSDDEALQQSLQVARRAIDKMQGATSPEATRTAVEATTRALETLGAVLQNYEPAPRGEPAPVAPAEDADLASPPATDDKTAP